MKEDGRQICGRDVVEMVGRDVWSYVITVRGMPVRTKYGCSAYKQTRKDVKRQNQNIPTLDGQYWFTTFRSVTQEPFIFLHKKKFIL